MANWHWTGQLEIGTAGQILTTGTGAPEGAVTAPVGSIYLRTDGGVGTSTYLKETGAGNTGWAAAAAGSTGPTGPTGPQAFGNYVSKTTSYAIQASDNNTVFSFSGITLTATLPATAPPVPWMIVIFNSAVGQMTLDFNGLHPDLPATLTLFSNQSAIVWSTGTTYTCIINSGWYTPAGSIISATGNAELDLFSTDDGGGWSLFDGLGNLIDTTSGTEMRFQTSSTFRFFGGGTTVQVDGILRPAGGIEFSAGVVGGSFSNPSTTAVFSLDSSEGTSDGWFLQADTGNINFQGGASVGGINITALSGNKVTIDSDSVTILGGPLHAPVVINAQTANYIAAIADADQLITMAVGGANTFTVPPHASVAFPVGTTLSVLQKGAGQVTLTPGVAVTINTPSSLTTRAQWSLVSVVQISTDVWVASGDLT